MRKLLALVVLSGLVSPAAAAIVCNDEYQVVNGQEISTPYCRDGYLAQVARESGWKGTAEQIRNNPNLKQEVCRVVGGDIRVRDQCNYDSGRGK